MVAQKSVSGKLSPVRGATTASAAAPSTAQIGAWPLVLRACAFWAFGAALAALAIALIFDAEGHASILGVIVGAVGGAVGAAWAGAPPSAPAPAGQGCAPAFTFWLEIAEALVEGQARIVADEKVCMSLTLTFPHLHWNSNM